MLAHGRASGCAAIANPAHESDARAAVVHATRLCVNEKFVKVAVNVATPSARVASPTFAHAPTIGHVGRGHDRHAPRPGYPAAEPHAAALVEEQVHARLHVDLVGAERAIVHRAAGVADHLGAHAVDGRAT